MTQLEFFKTFGTAIVSTIKDEQLAMKVVSKAWMMHRRKTQKRIA
ncbi:hypothetical protein [Alicyclobacillus fodiniaquatilis]|jgi:hypothetical protein|uniref:Uncharacterized protein n=1 Tax=Alicyclobacillus fodiniaquatilis TaxID=1661150 RepID=A0ABW4JN63_9BACL